MATCSSTKHRTALCSSGGSRLNFLAISLVGRTSNAEAEPRISPRKLAPGRQRSKTACMVVPAVLGIRRKTKISGGARPGMPDFQGSSLITYCTPHFRRIPNSGSVLGPRMRRLSLLASNPSSRGVLPPEAGTGRASRPLSWRPALSRHYSKFRHAGISA